MKIVVQIQVTGKQIELEADETNPLDTFKGLIEEELKYPKEVQILFHLGRRIESMNVRPLKDIGIKNNDLVLLASSDDLKKNPELQIDLNARAFIQLYLGNKILFNQIKDTRKELCEAILNQDVNFVIKYISSERKPEEKNLKKEEQKELNLLEPEMQRKIERIINQVNIEENLESTQEYLPDSFVKVPMIFIDCSINKIPTQAFVDTGAQNTIITKNLAEKVGLAKLIDKRFKGVAIGVGKGGIIGRIHCAPLEVGGFYFPCSLTVIDSDTLSMELIFGLDNMRKYNCSIDLSTNLVNFLNGAVKVKFIQEEKVQETFLAVPNSKEEKKASTLNK